MSISKWNQFRIKFREILDYEEFGARTIINIFSIESSFGGVGLPINTLLEEIMPEAIEKSLLEYRQISGKKSTLGIDRVLIQRTD